MAGRRDLVARRQHRSWILADAEETRRTFGATLRSSIGEGGHAEGADRRSTGCAPAISVFTSTASSTSPVASPTVITVGRDLYPQDIEATVADASPIVRRGYVATFAVPGGHAPDRRTAGGGRGTGARAPAARTRRRHRGDPLGGLQRHGLAVPDVRLLPAGAIPRTTSGKLARRACRAHISRHAGRPLTGRAKHEKSPAHEPRWLVSFRRRDMVLKLRVPPDLIGGDVDAGYGKVADAFRATFRDGAEVGAAVAVYRDGVKVVDLWGGYRNGLTKDPWQADTMVNMFSTTKGVAALVVAVAVSRGLISYDAMVADYWPEFAQAGKGDVTVRQLLGHQAGVCALKPKPTLANMADPERLSPILASQAPAWRPGTRHGYHAITLGWYESELIRRTDAGRTHAGPVPCGRDRRAGGTRPAHRAAPLGRPHSGRPHPQLGARGNDAASGRDAARIPRRFPQPGRPDGTKHRDPAWRQPVQRGLQPRRRPGGRDPVGQWHRHRQLGGAHVRQCGARRRRGSAEPRRPRGTGGTGHPADRGCATR